MRNTQNTKIQISTTEKDGYPIVSVSGEIDLYTAPEFQDALTLAGRDAPVLIVDLSGISYIDSAGLSVLLLIYKRLSARGAAFFVVSPPDNPGVRRVMEVTRLDSLLSIRPTVEDVLRELHMQEAA